MFVARDLDGSLNLFRNKPTRASKDGNYIIDIWEDYPYKAVGLWDDLYPEITWKDEPLFVELC